MGRRANPEVARRWRERMARQAEGGLSVAEFCDAEGVTTASFYRWRRRLSGRKGSPSAAAKFVAVQMAPATPGVQIELPSGAVVSLPAEASAELVTTAIRAAHAGEAERC